MGRWGWILASFFVAACGSANSIPWSEDATSSPTGNDTPTPTSTPGPDGVVFQTDFEPDDAGFTVTGTNPSWEWGAPTSGPDRAASGSNAWATSLEGRYNENESSCLESPEIELPGAANPVVLRFNRWSTTEGGFDDWEVRVEDLDIGNEETLDSGSGGSPNQDYSADQHGLLMQAGHRIRVRFCLSSDQGVERDGLYIDDFYIGPGG